MQAALEGPLRLAINSADDEEPDSRNVRRHLEISEGEAARDELGEQTGPAAAERSERTAGQPYMMRDKSEAA